MGAGSPTDGRGWDLPGGELQAESALTLVVEVVVVVVVEKMVVEARRSSPAPSEAPLGEGVAGGCVPVRGTLGAVLLLLLLPSEAVALGALPV